ncbi:MAG: hypothetical protein M5R42_13340 [Rhodocyclaceae bacterium]|nr:hypothetical protein [Rhodocyclaceae bacterium]
MLEGQPISATTSMTPQSAPAPAAAPPPAAQQLSAPQPSMQEAARFARRFLLDLLGPDGDSLVGSHREVQDAAGVAGKAGKTREALEVIGSKRKAEEFWVGVQPRLPPA